MPIGQGYGDIFATNTPALDQLHNRLQQEQRQRAIQKERESIALDDEFAKNLYKIRDADADELTTLYSDWKNDYNRLQERGNKVTQQERADNLRKRAEIYKFGNKSISEKDWQETQGKAIPRDNKGYYVDDANDRMIELSKTPTNKITPQMRADLAYKFSIPDFEKYEKLATGDLKEIKGNPIKFGSEGHSGRDKFSDEIPVYRVANNPMKQYDIRLNSWLANNKQKNSIAVVQNSFTSDQEKEDLKNKYFAKIKTPEFIAAYGETPAFPESSRTQLGEAAMLQTMRSIVDAPNPKIRIDFTKNDQTKTEDSQAFALKKQAIHESNSNYRASLNKVRPSLGDYDILSIYDPKVQEIEIDVPTTGTNWLGKPNTSKQKVKVIYTKDIDGNDEKYFDGASPIRGKDGDYYIQRTDGDYEGANGKVIQRKTAAIKFMGNPAAYKGGVVNSGSNNPAPRKPTGVKDPKGRPSLSTFIKN